MVVVVVVVGGGGGGVFVVVVTPLFETESAPETQMNRREKRIDSHFFDKLFAGCGRP